MTAPSSPPNRRLRWAVGAVALTVLLVAGVAVVTSALRTPDAASASDSPLPTISAQCAGTFVASAEWQGQGRALASAKAAARAAGRAVTPLTPIQTAAVDITGPGTYVLRAGPIPAGQVDPADPRASAQFPRDMPDHFTLSITRWQVVDQADGQFLEITISLADFRQPYRCFALWLR